MAQTTPSAFLADLPGQLTEPQIIGLAPLVVSAYARGWTSTSLRSHIDNRYRAGEVVFPAAIYRRILSRLPSPPRRKVARHDPSTLPPPCRDHPGPDLPMRTREDQTGRLVKCPNCHPYSPAYIQLRTAVNT